MPVLAVRTCPFKRRRHPRPKSRKVWESLVKQRLEVSSTAEGCTGRRGEGPKPRSGWPSGLPRVRLEADRLPVGAYFGFCSSHCDFIRQTISLLPECRAEALLARLRSVSYRIISQSIWRAVMFQLGRKIARPCYLIDGGGGVASWSNGYGIGLRCRRSGVQILLFPKNF